MAAIRNLFSLGKLKDPKDEVFEKLLEAPGVLVERIVSTGQASPDGFWYDQPDDEWVALLQGCASLEVEGSGAITLKPGDYIFIAAHCRHRVSRTSTNPPCIWLAIHGHLKEDQSFGLFDY
jgi:cupin 2 domain-containing protein